MVDVLGPSIVWEGQWIVGGAVDYERGSGLVSGPIGQKGKP